MGSGLLILKGKPEWKSKIVEDKVHKILRNVKSHLKKKTEKKIGSVNF
jgi:hypothetical protein